MKTDKTNMSARVSCTLKEIVEDSPYSQKEAYELGAKLIAIGDAERINSKMDNNPNLKKILKKREYNRIEKRKKELEKELDDL